jgi:hypothetical protein
VVFRPLGLLRAEGRRGKKVSEGNNSRWLFIVGGICGIVYPVVGLSFYALYPLAAGGAIVSGTAQDAYMARMAALGERPLVIALEWTNTLLPLLLVPFALALYRLLTSRGQRNLGLVALSLILLSLALMLPSNAINATLNHDLARSYVETETEAEAAAIYATFHALGTWHRGLNQMASLLYQAFVGLSSLGLILGHKYRVRGWIGIAGALIALLKFTPGIPGMTNFLGTGLAYTAWPIAVGIGLLREPRLGTP